ncbi:MAG: BrnT family toxin [Acidithiobacillales bacterium]
MREVLDECDGFDWDQGNLGKNCQRHRVAWWECEQALLQEPLLVTRDPRHSVHESRYVALGKSSAGRRLFLAFTTRRKWIRVISARDMSRRERRTFEAFEKENP